MANDGQPWYRIDSSTMKILLDVDDVSAGKAVRAASASILHGIPLPDDLEVVEHIVATLLLESFSKSAESYQKRCEGARTARAAKAENGGSGTGKAGKRPFGIDDDVDDETWGINPTNNRNDQKDSSVYSNPLFAWRNDR